MFGNELFKTKKGVSSEVVHCADPLFLPFSLWLCGIHSIQPGCRREEDIPEQLLLVAGGENGIPDLKNVGAVVGGDPCVGRIINQNAC